MTSTTVQDPATAKSNAAETNDWVPVCVSSLHFAGDVGFDLYVRDAVGRGAFRLFRGRNVPIHKADIDKLQSRGVDTLYTSAAQADEYRTYLRESVLGDKNLPLSQRYQLLTQAARAIFEDAFRQGDVGAIRSATGELAGQLTELVNHQDVRLFDLVEVMLHDYSTYAHATRVCSYSLLLAQGLGIDDRQHLAQIAEGALLHDVGKLFLSDKIIHKSYQLTSQERELLRYHPTQGFLRLAPRDDVAWGTLMMIYQHHERVDGCGFPVGLPQEEIHPWARICAVANTYDAAMRDASRDGTTTLDKVDETLSLMAGRSLDEEMTACWMEIHKSQPPQS